MRLHSCTLSGLPAGLGSRAVILNCYDALLTLLQLRLPVHADVNKPLNRIFLATCDVPFNVVQDQTLKMFPHCSSCDRSKPGILTMRLVLGVYLGVSNLAVHASAEELSHQIKKLQQSTVSSLPHSVSFLLSISASLSISAVTSSSCCRFLIPPVFLLSSPCVTG